MRIAIDCRFWGPSHTGLGVYTKQLVENLAKIDRKSQYFLLLRQEAINSISLPANFTKILVDAPAYSFKEQILLPVILYRLHPDLVHFASINIPVLYFGHYVVTVHDLIKHYFRGLATSTLNPLFYWLKYIVYLIVSWWAVHVSNKIIVPSENVKNLLLKTYNLSPGKITTTYEAATILPSKQEAKIALPKKFAIFAGNAYPHKNLNNLIKAWEQVYAVTGAKLIIACGRSIFSEKFEKLIKQNHVNKYVSFVGYLNESQLRYAYGRASAYVFPSLMEGFGIPGLDAMSMSLPVACSNIEILHEVYGLAAHYFDPFDINDIATKIIEVIKDQNLRAKLIHLGKIQSAKYSWEKLARETLEVYLESFRA